MRPSTPRRVLAVLACLALSAALAVGQEKPAEKDAVDFSAPKPVAVAFARAMTTGDAKAVRETAVGTEEEYKTVDAVGTLFPAMKRFKAACDAKFGADNVLSRGMSAAEDPAAEVRKADVKVDGDAATVVNKAKPDEKEPMRLKRVGGKWKVDLSASMGKAAAESARKVPALAKVFADAAAEVEAGKYQNAQDAAIALEPRVREATR